MGHGTDWVNYCSLRVCLRSTIYALIERLCSERQHCVGIILIHCGSTLWAEYRDPIHMLVDQIRQQQLRKELCLVNIIIGYQGWVLTHNPHEEQHGSNMVAKTDQTNARQQRAVISSRFRTKLSQGNKLSGLKWRGIYKDKRRSKSDHAHMLTSQRESQSIAIVIHQTAVP